MYSENCKKSDVGSLVKVVIILAVFFLSEGVSANLNPISAYYRRGRVNKASCLSYGHACWGAHGKRSGLSPNNIFSLLNSDISSNKNKDYQSRKWILKKLLNPVNTRFYRNVEDFDGSTRNEFEDSNLHGLLDSESNSISSDLNIQDILKADQTMDDQSGKSMEKMFSPKFMEKRSTGNEAVL